MDATAAVIVLIVVILVIIVRPIGKASRRTQTALVVLYTADIDAVGRIYTTHVVQRTYVADETRSTRGRRFPQAPATAHHGAGARGYCSSRRQLDLW